MHSGQRSAQEEADDARKKAATQVNFSQSFFSPQVFTFVTVNL
jgi:hypothetical protein